MKEQPFHSLPIKKNKNKKKQRRKIEQQTDLSASRKEYEENLLVAKQKIIKRLAFKHFCVNL